MKNPIVIIDTDPGFHKNFLGRLKYTNLESQYTLFNIVPDVSLINAHALITDVISQINNLIEENNISIIAFLVDIVVFEDGAELDNTGVIIASRIKKEFPTTLCFNVTGKISSDKQLNIFSEATIENNDGVFSKLFLYDQSFTKHRLEKILNHKQTTEPDSRMNPTISNHKRFDVAIITAIFKDEFENIKPILNDVQELEDETKIYKAGKLENSKGREISVVAINQDKTGIVDAAVLATEIINKFNPEYLIMTGVCGGHGDEINLGDIVVASKVFLHQKGKETNVGFQNEVSQCELNAKLINIIRDNGEEILRLVKEGDPSRSSGLQLHIEPMSCGLSVINKNDYFKDNISKIDRNIIAVDMESFSIVRACQYSNDNKTQPIIIKSIMDKTINKDDNVKAYAGYTSAQFALHLIKEVLTFSK